MDLFYEFVDLRSEVKLSKWVCKVRFIPLSQYQIMDCFPSTISGLPHLGLDIRFRVALSSMPETGDLSNC